MRNEEFGRIPACGGAGLSGALARRSAPGLLRTPPIPCAPRADRRLYTDAPQFCSAIDLCIRQGFSGPLARKALLSRTRSRVAFAGACKIAAGPEKRAPSFPATQPGLKKTLCLKPGRAACAGHKTRAKRAEERKRGEFFCLFFRSPCALRGFS
jgi:hypothetical protein